MTKPDALLLTPVIPVPEGSGLKLRAWAWLKELSSRYNVHVIVFGQPGVAAAPESLAASVGFVPVRPPEERRWRRRLAKLLPFIVCWRGFGSDWPQVASDADVAKLLDGLEPEAIIVFRLYLHDAVHPVLERFTHARTDVDIDDFESRTRLSIALAHWRLGRWRSAIHELALSVQYVVAEQLLTRRYDHIHVAAPEDRLPLAKRTRAEVTVFPNRLAPPRRLPRHHPTRLLFVGSLDYPPNELAAHWLMEMAAPLRARLPDLLPTIIGRRPDDVLRQRLGRCDGLEFIEDATDLAPYYGAAAAVLVPLRAGGGTKLKTIEAFAHARPVISTREGVRGLGGVAEEHYLLAETTTEFVDAIERLTGDPLLAQRIGRAGYSLWRDRYSL